MAFTASLFTTLARSITLAVTTLGLVGATVYEFVANGSVDPTLLTMTTGIVGAFTGAHISFLAQNGNGTNGNGSGA